MTLLFTSLFASGTMPAAAPPAAFAPPEPGRLLWWLRADHGVLRGDGEPAGDGDPVAAWLNAGVAHDVVQGDPARRPLLGTGGFAGRPFLACSAGARQHFEDLAFAQPSGILSMNTWTVFAVTDAVDPGLFPALLGSPASNGGKMGLYFRPAVNEQVHFVKSQIRRGNLANPQILMGAAGRSADGATSSGYARFWVRQNRADLYANSSQTSNLVSTAIASTQFLRNTGIAEGGYFDGRLHEVLFYDGLLSNADTFAVEDYLAQRFGIA